MSETKTAVKKTPGIAQLAVTLLAISAVCALLLGLVNLITADKIAAAKAEKTAAAKQLVLAADTYEPMSFVDDSGLVVAMDRAGDAGYVVQVRPSGFGGLIDMMVGVNADGTVSGVSIISMSETSGLGSNAKKDWFREQFVGGSGTLRVNKDGGDIQALTGATITSRAVTNGVNAALAAVAALG